MKACTTAPILGLLAVPAWARMAAVKESLEIEEKGVNFQISRFTDGRSTPYRIYFGDKHLSGSSYRLSQRGHVEYFKAGSEVYYDRMEMDDESLTYLMKTKTRARSPETGAHHLEQDLPGCDECTMTWDVVCEVGLPMFCDKIRRHSLSDDGADSVEMMCGRQEGACDTAKRLCEHVCAAEKVQSSSTCANGFVGIQASNGACCAAGCGQCGGVGCSQFGKEVDLDRHDCCATEIVDMGTSCSEAGKAPCYIDEGSGDDLREVVMGTRRLMGAGWRDAECRRASLTAEDLESLDVFDFDMYIDPGCMETIEHRPNGCNFMGLGQGCRGCYETCEGALYYVKMHKTKIRKKGEAEIIKFCPDSGLSSIDQCRED